jgi:hypothetical protein
VSCRIITYRDLKLFGYEVGRICEGKPTKTIVDEIGYLGRPSGRERRPSAKKYRCLSQSSRGREAFRGERYILWRQNH